MKRYRCVEVGFGGAHLDGDSRHLHDLGGVRAENMAAKHFLVRAIDHADARIFFLQVCASREREIDSTGIIRCVDNGTRIYAILKLF